MPTIKRSHVIRGCTVDQLWLAIVDFEAYPDYMSDVVDVEVERRADGIYSHWHIDLDGVQFKWTERDFINVPDGVDFKLVDGDISELSGSWRIEAVPDGHRVMLEMSFDIGIPSLAEIFDPLAARALEQNLVSMLKGIEQRVGGGAARIRPASTPKRTWKFGDHPIHLAAFAAELGNLVPLDALEELDETTVNTLNERGLRTISCFANEAQGYEALIRVASQVLEKAGIAADAVEAVFFTTGAAVWTLDDDRLIIRALGALGLTKATLIGTGLGSCANTGTCFRVAQSMMRCEDMRVAMVLTLDRVAADLPRLTPPDVAVNADGASAALLIAGRQLGFELLGAVNFMEPQLAIAGLSEREPQRFLELHIKGIFKTLSDALAISGHTVEDLSAVIAPNLNPSLIQLISAATGIRASMVHAPNIAIAGHVQTTDALLNLQSIAETLTPVSGDIWASVSCSEHGWSAQVFRYCAVISNETPKEGLG